MCFISEHISIRFTTKNIQLYVTKYACHSFKGLYESSLHAHVNKRIISSSFNKMT